MLRLCLFWAVLPVVLTANCIISQPLTNVVLKNLTTGCEFIYGDVVIRGKVNYDLLDRVLQDVRIIYGCIRVVDTNLDRLIILGKLEIINCTEETTGQGNIVYISGNPDLIELGWTSLTTLIGPGEIILAADNHEWFCLHTIEVALLYTHPQYRMRDFYLCEDASDIYDDCKYQPPQMYPKPICPVQNSLMMIGESVIEGVEVDSLRQTRVITGSLEISDTYLTTLDGLENLEVIVHHGQAAITIYSNLHLNNFTFPKLKKIVYKKLPIITMYYMTNFDTEAFCARHSIEFYDCENYTLQNVTCEEAVQNTPYIDGGYRDVYLFWSSLMGYPPLILAIIIQVRTFSIILCGNVRQVLNTSYIFLFLFVLINLLSLLDRLIVFVEIHHNGMQSIPQLYSTLFNNQILHIFSKCLLIMKEYSCYLLPCSFISAALGIILKKWKRISTVVQLIFLSVSAVVFLYFAILEYKDLLVLTFTAKFDNKEYRPIYCVTTETTILEESKGSFGFALSLHNYAWHLQCYTLYTDGAEFTEEQLYVEEIVLGLAAFYNIYLFLYSCFTRKNCFFHLFLPVMILIEYALLQYSRFRRWFTDGFFNCKMLRLGLAYNPCDRPYFFEHVKVMLIQRSFYVVSLLAAIIVWRMSWYLHCVGYTMLVIKARKTVVVEEEDAFSLPASFNTSSKQKPSGNSSDTRQCSGR